MTLSKKIYTTIADHVRMKKNLEDHAMSIVLTSNIRKRENLYSKLCSL